MNNQDYEKAKAECWERFCRHIVDEEEEFYNMFDRAYALGKQEKDAEKLSSLEEEIHTYAKMCSFTKADYIAIRKAVEHGISLITTNTSETAISGWVARDDGERWHERELHLFTRNKPERRKLMGDWIGRPSLTLDSNLFPDLTWDNDPIEVELTIKRKKK